MISIEERGPDGIRLVRSGAGTATATAFIDADWIRTSYGGPVPALEDDDRAAAAGRLLASADHIAGLVDSAPAGGVEVIGAGLVAHEARTLLGRRNGTGDRPAAIVDCSGDPAGVLDAIRRVCDLGVVVLAGEPLGRQLAIDLYVDVHRRGLRLIGAPRPGDLPPVQDDARVARALELLADVDPGAPVPADARWVAVSPG